MPNAASNLKKSLMHFVRDSISFVLYLFMMRGKRDGAVTLVYHSVGRIDPLNDPYRLNITPERFEEHLKVISKYKDKVRITFDDGYGNNFEEAFPLLVNYGLTATVFIITDFIDGRLRSQKFCGEGLDLRPLTWEEVRIMDKAGIIFGSHTKTHPDLATLPRAAIMSELTDSKRRIEESLGHAVDNLAYPFGGRGSFNTMVENCVAQAGYVYAYANIMGINKSDCGDAFSLRRVRIYSEDSILKLKMKVCGAYDWVDAFSIDKKGGK